MNRLICLTLLFLQSLASDFKILWSESEIHGQVYKVLYGGAVEFRCHNNTIDNLYEVTKDQYKNCESAPHQRSLLNCTRASRRGRDLYTILMVKHDIPDPYFKDYEVNQKYYFISTASDRGTDKERISNVNGGNCKNHDRRIILHVVNSLTQSPTEPSSDTEAHPDTDTANNLNDVEVIDTTNASSYNVSNNIIINDVDSGHTNSHDKPPDMQEIQTEVKSSYPHRISISSILLLTLLFLLYS